MTGTVVGMGAGGGGAQATGLRASASGSPWSTISATIRSAMPVPACGGARAPRGSFAARGQGALPPRFQEGVKDLPSAHEEKRLVR
jgi:hypothetical protein